MSTGASLVLQVIQPQGTGPKAAVCIEPWEALQQELEQCQALTLLTAVELLQSMCTEDSNAGEPSGIRRDQGPVPFLLGLSLEGGMGAACLSCQSMVSCHDQIYLMNTVTQNALKCMQ